MLNRSSSPGAELAFEDGASPRKIAGIAVVALLHVGVIYLLLSGLGGQIVQALRPPMQAQIIVPVQPPPQPPPPPPPPSLAPPPPVFIPPPIVQVVPPPQLPPPVIAAVTTVKPTAPPPPPVPAAPRSAAGLDPNQSCAAPEYPEDAEDMGQTGITVMQFLIGTNGQVLSQRVASSSGHAELDQTAISALSQCKFKPAIGADGQPQEAWTSIRYVWQLN